MKHEDAFSKLFRESADKIEETPSNDLWNRLEARLDERMPVQKDSGGNTGAGTGGNRGGKLLSFSRQWMAAASMVVMIFLAVGIIRMLQTEDKDNTPTLASAEDAPERNQEGVEDLTLDPSLPIAARTEKEQEQLLAQSDKIQAESILEVVAKKTDKPAADEILAVEERVTLQENLSEVDDIISLEVEPAASLAGTSSTTNSTNPELRRDAGMSPDYYSNSNLNYSNIVPTVSSADVQNISNDQDVARYKALEEAERMRSKPQNSISPRSTDAKNSIVYQQQTTSKPKQEKQTASGESAKLNSALQLFEWLLGSWQDTKQYEGVSYEEWTMRDPNTLVGKGYVVNLDKNSKLFQEQIRLEYRPEWRQVFLVATLDESGTEIDYMFSGYEEKTTASEYLFLQSKYAQYPERIILEKAQNSNAFTMIIVDKSGKKDALSTDQQRYLDNRNHVSGSRAIRNLSRIK